jgi:hypothetical protein
MQENTQQQFIRTGLAVLFLIAIVIFIQFTSDDIKGRLLLVIAAWIITVPATGMMAALFFFMIRGMMLPQ